MCSIPSWGTEIPNLKKEWSPIEITWMNPENISQIHKTNVLCWFHFYEMARTGRDRKEMSGYQGLAGVGLGKVLGEWWECPGMGQWRVERTTTLNSRKRWNCEAGNETPSLKIIKIFLKGIYPRERSLHSSRGSKMNKKRAQGQMQIPEWTAAGRARLRDGEVVGPHLMPLWAEPVKGPSLVSLLLHQSPRVQHKHQKYTESQQESAWTRFVFDWYRWHLLYQLR